MFEQGSIGGPWGSGLRNRITSHLIIWLNLRSSLCLLEANKSNKTKLNCFCNLLPNDEHSGIFFHFSLWKKITVFFLEIRVIF